MAVNTFVISDESVNSYGFVVLTSGIDTARFQKNPVMFYQHERESGIIGRWENIRSDGSQLLADAVFDEGTPLGLEVKQRVENGFIRSASIGVDNVEQEVINGVQTAVKCCLKEVSIVDIPANENAVKLYNKGGKCVYRLSDLAGLTPDEFRNQIIALLGLNDNAADHDILTALKTLLNNAETAEQSVNRALQMGYIDNTQRANFSAMAKADHNAFLGFVREKEKADKMQLDSILTTAIRSGKILPQERSLYERAAQVAGVALVSKIINTIPGRTSLMSLIRGEHKDRASWGLNEYRKYAPDELRDNPDLYTGLVKREGHEMELNASTLEYYRRNNPEYLKENPEEYVRLIKQTK